MSVGKRMMTVFEKRPGVLHAALTGFPPAWRTFAKITRGATSLAEIVRTHPVARRALSAIDRGKGAVGPAEPAPERDGVTTTTSS
jgi:hypothetical protein